MVKTGDPFRRRYFWSVSSTLATTGFSTLWAMRTCWSSADWLYAAGRAGGQPAVAALKIRRNPLSAGVRPPA